MMAIAKLYSLSISRQLLMTNITTPYASLLLLTTFIGGLALHLQLDTLNAVFTLIGPCFLVVAFLWRHTHTDLILGSLLACCAGYLLSSYHQIVWNEKQSTLMNGHFDVQGYVSDVVPLSSRPYLAAVHVTIQTLTQPNNAYSYKNDVLLHYVPCKYAPPVGSFATFTHIKPSKKLPSGDIAQYLRKNNVIHQLFSRSDMTSHLYATGPLATSLLTRFKQWICTMRARFYEHVTNRLSPLSKIYVGLMFFGNKQPESDETRTLFGRWGLAHFLARSGLHIVIFVLLVSFIFGSVPIHSALKELLLFVICLIYDALSWSTVSFLRAWLIALLVIMRSLLGRHTSYLHLLSLSCIIILAHNPLHLTSLDFQLTYSLTFTLALLGNLFTVPPQHQ